MNTKEKILITGGSGFIGKNLINFLKKKKFKLFVIENNKKINLNKKNKIKCSLNETNKILNFIDQIKPDYLIHLAWSGIPDFSNKNNFKNYIQQIKFIKMIKMTKIKKIFISGSCFEYGNKFGELKENMNIKKINNFAKVKKKIFSFSHQQLKRKLIWGRIFYVYGKYQRKGSLINLVTKSKKITLNDPFKLCDFIHIDDVCDAILKLSKSKYSGIINISSNSPLLVSEFCEISKKILNKKKLLFEINSKSKFYGNWGDNSKLINLGWIPKTNIKKGILKSI